MDPASRARALQQLIAIKREAMAVLKQDLSRLGQLVAEAETRLAGATACERDFLDECRGVEAGKQFLVAADLIARRRFLEHLAGQRDAAGRAVREVSAQWRLAQQAFETAYAEVSALERVADRRRLRLQGEQQRKDYLLADDLELARSNGPKGEYAEH